MEESDVNAPADYTGMINALRCVFTLTAETIVDASDAQIHYEI